MKKFIKRHILIIIAVFVVANSSILYLYFSNAASCMDQAMINADTRCLYVYNNNVYQKGSKSSPHQGVGCGRNVDSIIPSLHFSGSTFTKFNSAKIATFCANGETPIPSTSPTTRPTATATATTRPTATATTRPTATATSVGTIPNWDVDQNGVINVVDIGLVVDQYGKTNFTNPRVDIDRNGTVNVIDIGIIVDHYR